MTARAPIVAAALLAAAWVCLACAGGGGDAPAEQTAAANSPAATPQAGGTTMTAEVGSPAPDFALEGSDGQVHRLSDEVGKRAAVIAWFPKAFTGG